MVKKVKENAKNEKKIVEKNAAKVNEKKAKKNASKNKVTTFKAEMNKIKWPSKKDMIKYSISTVVFVIFFSIFFYVIELLMALLKSLV